VDVKGDQLYISHLFRNLTYLHELEPQVSWPVDIKELLQEANHKRKMEGWYLVAGRLQKNENYYSVAPNS
jgi:hypothetical protein